MATCLSTWSDPSAVDVTRDVELVEAVQRWEDAIVNLNDAASQTFGAELGSWWLYRWTQDTSRTLNKDIFDGVHNLNSFKPVMQGIHHVLVENGPGRRWPQGAEPPEHLAPVFAEFEMVVDRVNILRNVRTHSKSSNSTRDLKDQGKAGRAQQHYVGVRWIPPEDAECWNRLRLAIVQDCANATEQAIHRIGTPFHGDAAQPKPAPAQHEPAPAAGLPVLQQVLPREGPAPRLVLHQEVVHAIAAADRIEFRPLQPASDMSAQRAILSADGSIAGVAGSFVVLGSVVLARNGARWRPSAPLVDDASGCRLLAVAGSGQTGVRAIITTGSRTELVDIAAEGRTATRRQMFERTARAAAIVAGEEWLVDDNGAFVGWEARPPLDDVVDIDAARWGAQVLVAVSGMQAGQPACATARYRLGTPTTDIVWTLVYGVERMAVARQAGSVTPPHDVFFATE